MCGCTSLINLFHWNTLNATKLAHDEGKEMEITPYEAFSLHSTPSYSNNLENKKKLCGPISRVFGNRYPMMRRQTIWIYPYSNIDSRYLIFFLKAVASAPKSPFFRFLPVLLEKIT